MPEGLISVDRPMLKFCRESYYKERLTKGEEDPFDVRVVDISLPKAFGAANVDSVMAEFLGRFDSFSTRITSGDSGALFATRDSAPRVKVAIEAADHPGRIEDRQAFLKRERREIDIVGGLMAKFVFYITKNCQGSRVRILCSHWSIDYISTQILKSFFHEESAQPPLSASAGSYMRWIDTYANYACSEAGRREHDYWSRIDSAPFARVRRFSATLSGAMQKRMTLEIGGDPLLELRASAKEGGLRMVDIVAGAFAWSISPLFGFEQLPITWTTHGRFPQRGQSFTDVVGWLSNYHPILVNCVGTAAVVAARLRDTLWQLPLGGCGFAWIAQLAGKNNGQLERDFWSPFIVNIQEGAARVSGETWAASRSPAIVTHATSELPSSKPYRLYLVAKIGSVLSISVEERGACCDRAPAVLQSMLSILQGTAAPCVDRR